MFFEYKTHIDFSNKYIIRYYKYIRLGVSENGRYHKFNPENNGKPSNMGISWDI